MKKQDVDLGATVILSLCFALTPIETYANTILEQQLGAFNIMNLTVNFIDEFELGIGSDRNFTISMASSKPFLRAIPNLIPVTGVPTMSAIADFTAMGLFDRISPRFNPPDNVDKISVTVIPAGDNRVLGKFSITGAGLFSGGVKRGDALVPGFKIGGDPIFNLTNDTSSAIFVHDLQFFNNVAQLSDDAISALLDVDSNTGIDFSISPGQQSANFTVSPLDPGNWVYAQGLLTDSSGAVIGAFLEGAQAIPEPSGFTLFCLGVALSWLAYRSGGLRRI
jgi:hypothetical protein